MSLSIPHPTIAPPDQTIALQDQTQLADQTFILPDQTKLSDLKFTLQNNQRISSHQQINTEDSNQKPQLQSYKDLSEAQTGNQSKSKIRFLIAAIFILMIAAAIGLGIGLNYRYKASIKAVGPPTKINFDGGGSFVMNQYQLQKINFMEPDTKISMLISANVLAAQKNVTKRFLQQQQSNSNQYNVTIDINQLGLQLILSSDDKLGVLIEPRTFIKSLSQDEPNQIRLLADANQTDSLNQSNLYSEIQKQISKIFNDELSSNGSFQFKEQPMVEFKLNENTETFDIVTENKSDLNSVRRLLFLKGNIKKVKNYLNKVVKPIIETIRKNSKIIGTASGALIGAAIGTFVLPGIGTAAGAKIGSKIGGTTGLVAQTFVKACIPNNKIMISCNFQSISTALIDAAKSKAQGHILKGGSIKKPKLITKLGGKGMLIKGFSLKK